MNKQIEVQIMGQSYLLGCPDDGEGPLREAVERVDAAMCKIRDAGKVKARDRIAVLASLNLAFDLVRREAQPAAPPLPSSRPGIRACSFGPKPMPSKALPPIRASRNLSSGLIRLWRAMAFCCDAGVKSTASAVRVGL